MMTLDARRAQELAGQAETVDSILGAPPEVGTFSGVLGAAPAGVVRGLAAVQGAGAGILERATQPVYNALTNVTGIPTDNPFGQLRRASDVTVKAYTPDPLTVGTAGQIVGGVADIATKVAAGAALTAAGGAAALPELMWGGAAVAGGATGRTTYNELLAKGVDPSTAVNAGFIDAVTTGGGALLPAGVGFTGLAEPLAGYGVRLTRGGFIAANAGVGAATNVGVGIIQRGATQDALRAGGYDAMADQYAPMDGAALAADGILGGIFSGAGAALNLPAAARPTVDASLSARDAHNAAITNAPGIPADPNAAAAHGQALDKALRDVWDGNPVDVAGTGVQDQAFVFGRRDTTAADEAAREYGAPARAVAASTRLVDIPPAERTALPYNDTALNEYAAHVEQQYGIQPGLINALKNAGERSNSGQVSSAGARGVMQFTPENLRKYGVTDPTDPVQMIDAAGRYLRDTARQYGGDVDAMIADYNGGPRQAREVLAGREPTAPETRAYLARVREALGRGTAWAGQGPIEGAIRPVPQDRARVASAIEDEISQAEGARADLLADAGQSADLGEIRQVQDELSTLQQQRSALDADNAPRDRAKEIQASGPLISYKQALSQANREISGQAADLDARISRLQDTIGQNRGAARALQQLAELDQRIADLRANRAAIDAPASPLTPVAAAVREAAAPGERSQSAQDADRITQTAQQPAPSGEQASIAQHDDATPPATPPTPSPTAGTPRGAREGAAPEPRDTAAAPRAASQDGGTPKQDARAADAGVTDDIETRAGLALLDERGDITIPSVDENGQETQISLRQALADANAELEYVTPDALDAAIMCQLKGGA